MKPRLLVLALMISLSGCAGTFHQVPGDRRLPVQVVENSAKQNWINFLTATWQAVVVVVGVGYVISEMEDSIEEGLRGRK